MRNKVSALLIALLAFCAFGCGSGTDFNQISGQQGNVGITPPPPPPPEEDSAFLRLAHLSPNAGNVDILVGGTQVATNVAFEAFSNYLEVEAGTTRIQVRATGTTADVIDTNVNLVVDTHTTVAVIGAVGETANQGTGLQAAVLSDNVVPTANTLRARLFHTVPGAGPVRLATAEGDVLLGPVSFGQATGYAVIDVDGLDTDSLNLLNSDGQVIGVYTNLRNSETTLAGALENAAGLVGTNTTIAAAGGDTMPLIAALDQPAPAGGVRLIADAQEAPIPLNGNLRLAHMVPGEAQVDIAVSNEAGPIQTFTMVNFEDLTDYFEVPEGTVTVTVTAHDMDTMTQETPLFEGDFEIAAGTHNTISVVLDDEEEGVIGIQYDNDNVQTSEGNILLRFIHNSPLLGAEDGVGSGPSVALAVFAFDPSEDGPLPKVPLVSELVPTPLTPAIAYPTATGTYVSIPVAVIGNAALLGAEIRVVTLDENGDVDESLAILTNVRDSEDDIFEALAALAQANGGQVNVTAFAAGSGEIEEIEDEDDILLLSVVVAVDDADAGGDTVIVETELPEQPE